MPSLLPHDLCHGRSASRWLPAVIEFQLSCYRSSLNMQYAGSLVLSLRCHQDSGRCRAAHSVWWRRGWGEQALPGMSLTLEDCVGLWVTFLHVIDRRALWIRHLLTSDLRKINFKEKNKNISSTMPGCPVCTKFQVARGCGKLAPQHPLALLSFRSGAGLALPLLQPLLDQKSVV